MGKKSNKKTNTFAAGIALIAAAVVIIGCGIFWIIKDKNKEVITPGGFTAVGEEDSATACQNLMSSYYSAIMGGDGEALCSLMAPPEYWDYYMEVYGKTEEEIISTYSDAISNTVSSWRAECGNDAKVSFKIESSGDEPDEFLTQWNENIGSSLGNGGLTAEEAILLNVSQTVKGSSGSLESNNTPILIKVNGVWYILDEGISEE
ncbi:MAG: hypothetical protein ACI4JN_12070 [Ruminococcus sp.]